MTCGSSPRLLQLLQSANMHCGDDRFGLHVAEGIGATLCSPDKEIESRKLTLGQLFDHISQSLIDCGIVQPNSAAQCVRYRFVADSKYFNKQNVSLAAELIAGSVAYIIKYTDGILTCDMPRYAFPYPEPHDLKPYACLRASELSFNSSYAFVDIHKNLMTHRISTERLSEVREVCSLIISILKNERLPARLGITLLSKAMMRYKKQQLASLAGILHYSPRTLQNKLSKEHTSYHAILEHVRKNMASYYLTETELSLRIIAALLGFQQYTSFSRWFHAAFNFAPIQRELFRANLTSADSHTLRALS